MQHRPAWAGWLEAAQLGHVRQQVPHREAPQDRPGYWGIDCLQQVVLNHPYPHLHTPPSPPVGNKVSNPSVAASSCG